MTSGIEIAAAVAARHHDLASVLEATDLETLWEESELFCGIPSNCHRRPIHSQRNS